MSLNNSAFSQSKDIVKIVLETGKSDVLRIGENTISKAEVIGTEENIIKFLISDKYLDHHINKGVIYNFIYAGKAHLTNELSNTKLKSDSNKILIVIEDSIAFKKVSKNYIHNEPKSSGTVQLAEVNDLSIFVSDNLTDTIIFNGNKELVKVSLEENKSDIFQINGTTVAKVCIFGTKENIIRFLINDKYIKHKMDEDGSNYSFIYTDEYKEQFKTSENITNKLLIVIQNPDEFKKATSQIKKKTDTGAYKLEELSGIDIVLLPPVITADKK